MSLIVLAPGLQTTVQDLGRVGFRYLGVAVGGVLDPFALQAGNALLGNRCDAAALEYALVGPTLRAGRELLVVPMGAAQARLDGVLVPGERPLRLVPGQLLQLGTMRQGARGWLCVAGGIEVPAVLGSRSTDLGAGFGGFDGRALRAGDVLPIGAPDPAVAALLQELSRQQRVGARWGLAASGDADRPVRVLPHADRDLRDFCAEAWTVSPDSNRMGLRLCGTRMQVEAQDMQLSAGVGPGSIQLPAGGQPIVLLADAQTIGGYPLLGAVIRADWPRLAQARPGSVLRFSVVSLAEAEAAFSRQQADLARLSIAAAARLAVYS